MTRVVLADVTSEGMDTVLAGLLMAAAEDPAKARVLSRMRGSVRITITDADTELGLVFTPREIVVSCGASDADVHLSLPAASLMSLAAVPRWGVIPRFTTPAGRNLYRQIWTREVRVRGVRHVRLVRGLMGTLAT